MEMDRSHVFFPRVAKNIVKKKLWAIKLNFNYSFYILKFY